MRFAVFVTTRIVRQQEAPQIVLQKYGASPFELGLFWWFAGQPSLVCQRCHSGSGFKRKSIFFAANPGTYVAGIGTSLMCHRRNYAGFMRISWIFAGKWAVFLRIKGNQAGKCGQISGFLMRGQWSLIAVDAVYKPFFS